MRLQSWYAWYCPSASLTLGLFRVRGVAVTEALACTWPTGTVYSPCPCCCRSTSAHVSSCVSEMVAMAPGVATWLATKGACLSPPQPHLFPHKTGASGYRRAQVATGLVYGVSLAGCFCSPSGKVGFGEALCILQDGLSRCLSAHKAASQCCLLMCQSHCHRCNPQSQNMPSPVFYVIVASSFVRVALHQQLCNTKTFPSSPSQWLAD